MGNTLIIKVKDCDIEQMRNILTNAFIRHGLEIVEVTEEKDKKEYESSVLYDEQSQQKSPYS